ncbi:MAG: type II methionyl aminopeptidase [Candidatus Thorarchaeota archaeon]|nr:MAG: type II methionyl aminopeptidase [Candidatus Thorarchaeota archaeon]
MGISPHPAHLQSGKIASRVLREVAEEVKPGARVLTLCRLAEKKIIDYGGMPAFPCNICVNDVAAHYTSPRDDRSTIPSFGLVKIDIGVHIDGYIADTAKTVDLDGTLEGFVSATDDAIEEAVAMIRPGLHLSEVGRKIESVIKAYGLRPVKELAGHSLERYKLHAGKGVPNHKTHDAGMIVEGEYYAIEPFATSGTGVTDTKNVYIFANTGVEKILDGVAEKLRVHLRERYGLLPFASRWVGTSDKDIDVLAVFKELLKSKVIRGYAVLSERSGRPVAQTEHTVFVSKEGAVVLTRPD